MLAKVQNEETRLATVEETEAVALLLDVQVRPGVAVDHDGVAEEFWIPNRG